MTELKEEWKDMSDYFREHDNYEVSNTGFVRNKKTKNVLAIRTKDRKGYKCVGLNNNNKRRYMRLHVIVGRTWIPNPDNLPQLDHINPNRKDDNSILNLRWTTTMRNCWNRVLKPIPVLHRLKGDVHHPRLMKDGKEYDLGYFNVKALAELKHDEAVLKRDPEHAQLYFPALSRLIYAYENNIPVKLLA